MANPNNAVGTNGAFGGRTSVNAFNDVLATFTGRGVIQGWAVTPSTGLKVNVGGQSGIRDVAIAEDNNGNRTTIDNISQAPIEVTMPSAPSTGSRIDLIVGYVENPPQGSSTVIDNPAPTGIITVSGSSSSSPSAPTDSAIRTALTNAGINGATAYYAVLGSITISSGTTDISANMIGATPYTNLNTQNNIATGQITADKIDFATICATISSTVTCTKQSYTKVNLNNAAGQNGNLTLSNGGVLIGEGISRVQISSAAYFTSGDSSMSQTYSIYIYKNNTSTTVLRGVKRTNSIVYDQIQAPAHVCEVTQGDILYMYIRNQSGADAALSADPVYSFMNVWAIG